MTAPRNRTRRPTRPAPVDITARLTPGNWCYWIPEDQDPTVHGGFVPSVVIRGEAGHRPMTGDPAKLQTPWVWGKTLEAARAVAREVNARMGIDEVKALRIVDSSIAAQIRDGQRGKRPNLAARS